MESADYIAILAEEGRSLAEAAAEAGTGAPVPSCPGWTVADLLGHTGAVHRWAASFVETGRMTPTDDNTEAGFQATAGDRDDLLDWYWQSHANLVAVLRAAEPDLKCWTFLPTSSPLRFWARRQAHETAIHRVDAQLACGTVTWCEPGFAADGVDELIMGFMAHRSRRLVCDHPVGIDVVVADTGARWSVDVDVRGCRASAGDRPSQSPPADVVLTGPAHLLYLLLWNRIGTDGLDVEGDPAVLDLWRERATVL